VNSVIYAADMVVLTRMGEPDASVLLIRRRYEPFRGMWALPGGLVEPNETPRQAAPRELEEEAGIALDPTGTPVDRVGHYDDPDRDPRGRVVSIAFVVELDHPVPPKAGDDAAHAEWVELRLLDPRMLAFDHYQIIQDAMELNRGEEVNRMGIFNRQQNETIRQKNFTLPGAPTMTPAQRVAKSQKLKAQRAKDK
jgi:8-oxo-dGTP diphosphatase